MRANVNLLWVLTVFFLIVGTIYTVWSVLDPAHGKVEWAGTFAILLSGVLSGFIAFYLSAVHKGQGGEIPEDRLDANIDDGDPELGFYSPWSWWPIMLAASTAMVFLGLAVGFWVAFIGLGIAVISLVGWVYEYYRGYFAR